MDASRRSHCRYPLSSRLADESFRLFFYENLREEFVYAVPDSSVFRTRPSDKLKEECAEDLDGLIKTFEEAGVTVRRPQSRPIAPGERCTSRTRKTTMIAVCADWANDWLALLPAMARMMITSDAWKPLPKDHGTAIHVESERLGTSG